MTPLATAERSFQPRTSGCLVFICQYLKKPLETGIGFLSSELSLGGGERGVLPAMFICALMIFVFDSSTITEQPRAFPFPPPAPSPPQLPLIHLFPEESRRPPGVVSSGQRTHSWALGHSVGCLRSVGFFLMRRGWPGHHSQLQSPNA